MPHLITPSGSFPPPSSARPRSAVGLELRTIGVDTTMTEDDLARLVTEAFGKG
ncbi:hypothetical protein SNL152K_4821 [Streptomyces sp. NL15-2K]|nr:hypothetical protein SNL152K_4821 [Streptomyces sp. NL15-2K]